MRTVKKIIMLLVVIAFAYLAFHHFLPNYSNDTGNQSNSNYENTWFTDYAPPIPSSCQSKADDLENAIYGAENYDSSYIQRNRSSRILAACLRDAGFSEDEINTAIDRIRKKAEKLRRVDNQ